MIKKVLLIILLIIITVNIFSVEGEHSVTISRSYKAPESIKDPKTIILETDDPGEYIEIIVNGIILDFQIVQLTFDGEHLIETEQKHLLNKIENNSIIVLAYQTENIPSSKIKWKDSIGNEFEYIIRDQNSGIGDGSKSIVFNIY